MKSETGDKRISEIIEAITIDTVTCSATVDLKAAGIPQGPAVTVRLDAGCAPVVEVPLRHDGGCAVTTVDALARLLHAGISPDWFVTRAEDGTPGDVHGYHSDGKPVGWVTIARAIAGSISTSAGVCYADGDPLNLRPSNLVIREGGKETSLVGRALAH